MFLKRGVCLDEILEIVNFWNGNIWKVGVIENKKGIYMLMKKFKVIDERYVGIAGGFWRDEESRKRLGKIDSRLLCKMLSDL